MDITKLLGLLSKKEWKKFGDFIKSPYFNTEPRFISLFEILEASGPNVSREEIAEKIFGSKQSSGEVRFRKLVSEFKKLFKSYISQTEYDTSELTKRKMQLQWLRRKKDIDGYLKLAVDTESYIKDNCEKDEEYYLELTVLLSKIYDFKDTVLHESKNDFSISINNYLDKYFVAMKLFLFHRMNSLEYSANLDANKFKTFEKSTFEYIEANKSELKSGHPEIYLRYLAILLDKNGFDQALYDEYLDVLFKTEGWFKINENGLLLTLLSIISKFINSGRNDLSEKVIEIAEILHEKGILLARGIGYVDLKIIIEAAIGLGKFDWALSYMNIVKSHIRYDFPENVYNMLTGKVLFFKSDYKTARLLLSRISIDDYIFYCEAKLIECRIAYMGNDFESVLQISESVKKYLRSHKNIGEHFVSAYSHFVYFVKQLTMIQMTGIEKNEFDYRILALKKEIDSLNSPCYANNWLKEQILNSKAGY